MYGLKLVGINPPTLFLNFKGSVHFNKYFKISFLVSKTSWDFNWDCLESLDQFVGNCYPNIEPLNP